MDKKYDIIRAIGQGNFGVVHLVRAKDDGLMYVVKEVPLRGMKPEEATAAHAEAQLMSTLKHPCIVGYRESMLDTATRTLWIVLEYCSGGDLSAKIEEQQTKTPAVNTQPLSAAGAAPAVTPPAAAAAAARPGFSESTILDWLCQLCCALQYLHARNVIHRDLKAQNIFLTADGKLKLGDFGISKVLNSDTELAKTIIGTPYYLSPEICEGKAYAKKSDVWSLGCVLYELCTLRHAFDGSTLPALVMKILSGAYPPIPVPPYSVTLQRCVTWMLQQHPDRRPAVNELMALPAIAERIKSLGLEPHIAAATAPIATTPKAGASAAAVASNASSAAASAAALSPPPAVASAPSPTAAGTPKRSAGASSRATGPPSGKKLAPTATVAFKKPLAAGGKPTGAAAAVSPTKASAAAAVASPKTPVTPAKAAAADDDRSDDEAPTNGGGDDSDDDAPAVEVDERMVAAAMKAAAAASAREAAEAAALGWHEQAEKNFAALRADVASIDGLLAQRKGGGSGDSPPPKPVNSLAPPGKSPVPARASPAAAKNVKSPPTSAPAGGRKGVMSPPAPHTPGRAAAAGSPAARAAAAGSGGKPKPKLSVKPKSNNSPVGGGARGSPQSAGGSRPGAKASPAAAAKPANRRMPSADITIEDLNGSGSSTGSGESVIKRMLVNDDHKQKAKEFKANKAREKAEKEAAEKERMRQHKAAMKNAKSAFKAAMAAAPPAAAAPSKVADKKADAGAAAAPAVDPEKEKEKEREKAERKAKRDADGAKFAAFKAKQRAAVAAAGGAAGGVEVFAAPPPAPGAIRSPAAVPAAAAGGGRRSPAHEDTKRSPRSESSVQFELVLHGGKTMPLGVVMPPEPNPTPAPNATAATPAPVATPAVASTPVKPTPTATATPAVATAATATPASPSAFAAAHAASPLQPVASSFAGASSPQQPAAVPNPLLSTVIHHPSGTPLLAVQVPVTPKQQPGAAAAVQMMGSSTDSRDSQSSATSAISMSAMAEAASAVADSEQRKEQLSSQIERYQAVCESALGDALFRKVYNWVQTQTIGGVPAQPPTGAITQETVLSWLKPAQVPFLRTVYCLVHCEALYYG